VSPDPDRKLAQSLLPFAHRRILAEIPASGQLSVARSG
jgi:hypothetical protein